MMKKTRKDSARTRQLLLTASFKVFCEKGFKDATIFDICSRAGTNIASVNYHFGDKANLYREAWLYMYNESVKKFPIDGGVGKNAPPEDRLRGYIRSLMLRIITEPNDISMFHREMANPTGLLQDIMTEKFKVQFEKGKEIIEVLLGENATEENILFCHTSILGQCFHLGGSRKKESNDIKTPDLIEDVDAYCDHVIQFSLAGIRNIGGINNAVEDEHEYTHEAM